jgi:hypothetical protein
LFLILKANGRKFQVTAKCNRWEPQQAIFSTSRLQENPVTRNTHKRKLVYSQQGSRPPPPPSPHPPSAKPLLCLVTLIQQNSDIRMEKSIFLSGVYCMPMTIVQGWWRVMTGEGGCKEERGRWCCTWLWSHHLNQLHPTLCNVYHCAFGSRVYNQC